MIRPNVKLGDRLGAALRYQATISGMTVMRYVGKLIYEDLKKQQPELMKDVSVNEICVTK